jgi:hypothetical protein
MFRYAVVPGLRLALSLVLATVSVLSAYAGPGNANAIEARVRELHARTSEVNVTLLDNTKLQGRILRFGADSFTIREKTGRQTTIQYTRAKEVRKSGLSRRTRAILIPAVIGGSAVLVLCAAPYPIGFLCRKDPS